MLGTRTAALSGSLHEKPGRKAGFFIGMTDAVQALMNDLLPSTYVVRRRGPMTAILNDGSALYLAGFRAHADPAAVFMVESLRHLREQVLHLTWEPDEIGVPMSPVMMQSVA